MCAPRRRAAPDPPLTNQAERTAWIDAVADVARRRGQAAALSGAACAIGSLLGDDAIRVAAAPPASVPDAPAADPHLLDELHHRLLGAGQRRAGGVARTPPPLAAAIVARALDGAATPRRAVDPACGGGVFALALADALAARGCAIEELLGEVLCAIDIDPTAAAVTSAALTLWARSRGSDATPSCVVVGDALVELARLDRCDLVVGNPPFRSPVGAGGATAAGGGGMRYADDAARFLDAALRAVDTGVVALVVPRALLGADDAAAVRALAGERGALREVWLDERPSFEGNEVRVAVPIVDLGSGAGAAAGAVAVTSGLPPRHVADVERARVADRWSAVVAASEGIPAVRLGGAGVLGDRWQVTAGFRDEFYALAAVVREHDASHRGCRPVVTSGLIDPLTLRWGVVAARIGGRRLLAPCIDPDELAVHHPRVARWCDARATPKLLVATQTPAIEVVVDRTGVDVPCTPVVAVQGEDPWSAAAVLCSPAAAAWLLGERAGTGRSVGSVRVSASALRSLPLPVDIAAWRAAAAMIEELDGAPDAAWMAELGAVMAAANRCGPDVVAWWLPRVTGRLGAHR